MSPESSKIDFVRVTELEEQRQNVCMTFESGQTG